MQISTKNVEPRIVTVDRISKSGDRIAYPIGDAPTSDRKSDGIHLPAKHDGKRVSENEIYKVEIVARDEGYPRARILRSYNTDGMSVHESQDSNANRLLDKTVEQELKERYADFMGKVNGMHRPN